MQHVDVVNFVLYFQLNGTCMTSAFYNNVKKVFHLTSEFSFITISSLKLIPKHTVLVEEKCFKLVNLCLCARENFKFRPFVAFSITDRSYTVVEHTQ